MSSYRSFSQWAELNQCQYRYYLHRIEHVPQIQAAWTAQGTAVHTAMENWERGNRKAPVEAVQDTFRDEYDLEISKSIDKEPNLRHWFASGPYEADEDIPRRAQLGVEQIEKSLKWYDKHPDQVPWYHPDGRIGIELPFKIKLEDIEIRGFIDWFGRLSDTCELGPRDIKTGRKPGQHMQLKIYDLAMDDHYAWAGKERPEGPSQGDFFMTRTGKPTVPLDLAQVTRDEVTQEFINLELIVESGVFEPNPSEDNCKFCPVRRKCRFRAV